METPKAPPQWDTALFIDLENLLCGYQLTDEETKKLNLKGLVSQVHEQAGLVGRIAISRAYANWQSHKTLPLHPVMNELNISQQHVQAVNVSQKNLADIALCTDVMDVLHTRPNVKTFVIISGDGGFAWLVRRLNEYGKNVIIGAYESQTNKVLKDLADVFLGIEDPRQETVQYRHPDATIQALQTELGVFDALHCNLADVQRHVKKLFAAFPEIAITRKLLEEGVVLSTVQTWFEGLITGFNTWEIFGVAKFQEFVMQYNGSAHYRFLQYGSVHKLQFVPTLAVAAAPAMQTKVELPADQPRQVVQAMALANFASSNDPSQILKQLEQLVGTMVQDIDWDFNTGEKLERLTKEVQQHMPWLQPFKVGAISFEHLIAEAITKHDIAIWSPKTGVGPLLLAFADCVPKGYGLKVMPKLNATHSVANYKNAMADQGITKWFFVVESPALVEAVGQYVKDHERDNLLLADWVRKASDKLHGHAALKGFGLQAKGHVQNMFLAFNAAGIFERTPTDASLQNQHLRLRADIISASRIRDILRQQCAVKIAKVIGTEPQEDIMKLITG